MRKLYSTAAVGVLVFGVAAEHANAGSLLGSRIRGGISESPVPVDVIDRDRLETAGNVDDLSTLLPTLTFPGVGQTVQGAGGNVSLRGLGTGRTLVLVNGQRRPSGTAWFANERIPADLIETVEVCPDGASAIYGSDAVAGVVNFITTGPNDHQYGGLATEDAGDIVIPATTLDYDLSGAGFQTTAEFCLDTGRVLPWNIAITASGYDLSGSGSVSDEQFLNGLGVNGIGGIPGVFVGFPTDLIEGTVDADRRGGELSFELGKPKRFGLHPAGAGPFGGNPVNFLGYNRRGPSTSVTTAYGGLRLGTFDQSLESQFIADTPAFGINSAWDAQYSTEYDATYYGAYVGASFSRTYYGGGDRKTTFSLTGTLGVNFYDVDVQETVDANGLGGGLNYSNATNHQFSDELFDATLRFGVDRQRGNFSTGLYLDCDFGGLPEINRELLDSDAFGALDPIYSLSARPSTEIGVYARWAY